MKKHLTPDLGEILMNFEEFLIGLMGDNRIGYWCNREVHLKLFDWSKKGVVAMNLVVIGIEF